LKVQTPTAKPRNRFPDSLLAAGVTSAKPAANALPLAKPRTFGQPLGRHAKPAVQIVFAVVRGEWPITMPYFNFPAGVRF